VLQVNRLRSFLDKFIEGVQGLMGLGDIEQIKSFEVAVVGLMNVDQNRHDLA
jgi:hypothetical protein